MKKFSIAPGVLMLSAALVMTGCSGADTGKEKEKEKPAETEVTEEEEEEATPTEAPEEENIIVIDEEDDDEDEENLDFLYEQYYEIISDLDPKWNQFQFINLDDDDYPEIFITCDELNANGLREYMLITHSNAGAELIDGLEDGVAGAGGYRGILSYVAGMGIVYENYSNAPYNNPGANVYLLDNGHLNLYASGYTEVLDGYEGPDDAEHMSWFWNNEEVTAAEYQEALEEETVYGTGIDFEAVVCMERDTMLERLEDQMQ